VVPTRIKPELGPETRVRETIERLTRRSTRIEARFGDSLITTRVVSQSPAVRKSLSDQRGDQRVEPVDALTNPSLRTAERDSVTPAWPDLARASESMSIEEITDQVMRRLDQRVVAARERIGKTF